MGMKLMRAGSIQALLSMAVTVTVLIMAGYSSGLTIA